GIDGAAFEFDAAAFNFDSGFAFDADLAPPGMFMCGGSACDPAKQFCANGGAAGGGSACGQLPTACLDKPTCDCVQKAIGNGVGCTANNGQLTLTPPPPKAAPPAPPAAPTAKK